MITKYFYKDSFAVIGKASEGSANNPQEWIPPLWVQANAHFAEIAALARKNENGIPFIWGAMNDADESNKRWGETGKYMAGCEADVDAQPPKGWTKWIIPAQTYLVVETTASQYGEIFGAITNDTNIKIVGTVHERYPEPGNPNVVELWFPIAAGKTHPAQPTIIQKEKLTVVGLTGDGNNTGGVWEQAEAKYGQSPFLQADKNGYEIRFFSATHSVAPGRDIHVGFVSDKPIGGFDSVTLPASLYAVFNVLVANGYDSENAAMNKWLADNASVYRQRELDGCKYVVECYIPESFKGGNQPDSVVEIWIPISV